MYFPSTPLSFPNPAGNLEEIELSKIRLEFNADAFKKIMPEMPALFLRKNFNLVQNETRLIHIPRISTYKYMEIARLGNKLKFAIVK